MREPHAQPIAPSKFAFAWLHLKAGKTIAAQFLRDLIAAVPYAIHTVLTDNGIRFTNQARHKYAFHDIFDRVCDENRIEAGGRVDRDVARVDEPLNTLDIHHAVALMRLFRRMGDQPGKTVVIVLHDLNVAATYADRVVVLKDSRVAGDSRPAEVIDERLLSEVFRVDGEVLEIAGRRVITVAR